MATLPQPDTIANEIFEAASKRREEARGYLGMSSIGDPCERKLWYMFRGFTPVPLEGRALMIFELGKRIEDIVLEYLSGSGYRIEATQAVFEDFNGLFRGHCDGVIHGITQRPHILEIKSANRKKFDMFKADGVQKTYPVYWAQVQCYMGYAGLERAIVVVYCKDNSDIYSERIHFNRHEFEELRRKAYRIIIADDAPGKAFTQESLECRYCDYRILCWNPTEHIQTVGQCKNCVWLRWDGLSSLCSHRNHSFPVRHLDRKCDDWSLALFTKTPFIKEDGTLAIPFDSHPRYHWWNGGQSIADTLAELGADSGVIEDYVWRWEERAGIIEADNEVARAEAERRAMEVTPVYPKAA